MQGQTTNQTPHRARDSTSSHSVLHVSPCSSSYPLLVARYIGGGPSSQSVPVATITSYVRTTSLRLIHSGLVL